MSQTLGANFTGNMQMAQNQWNNQFANSNQSSWNNWNNQFPNSTNLSPSNPTNPNPYDFNWDSQTINPYIQGGGNVTNPYQYGGDQKQFLADRDIYIDGLSEEEYAFLPSMDRLNTAYDRMNVNVGMARTGLGFNMDAQQLAGQQNLLSMTGGQGLSSIGGFGGRSGSNLTSNIANQGQAYRTNLNQQMAGFQSDILGMQYDFQDAQSNYQDALTTALGNIAASEETDLTVSTTPPDSSTLPPDNNTPPPDNSEQGAVWSPPLNPSNYDNYDFNGTMYTFYNGAWLNPAQSSIILGGTGG